MPCAVRAGEYQQAAAVAAALCAPCAASLLLYAPGARFPLQTACLIALPAAVAVTALVRALYALCNGREARKPCRLRACVLLALCLPCAAMYAHAAARAAALCLPLRNAYPLALVVLPCAAVVLARPGRCARADSAHGALLLTLLVCAYALCLGYDRQSAFIAQRSVSVPPGAPLMCLGAPLCALAVIAPGTAACPPVRACRVSALAGCMTALVLVLALYAGRGRLIGALCGLGAGGFYGCAALLGLCAAIPLTLCARLLRYILVFTFDSSM